MPSFRSVAALSRGLEVLRAVNPDGRATVGSLHARTGIDKATIVRMLETLEEQGYLIREPDGPSYVPAGKVRQLSAGYNQHVEVARKAAPILEELRKKVSWPTNLAIFDGDAMVKVETVNPIRGMAVVRETGYRFPLLTTSLGLAYLANLPSGKRSEIIARLARDPSGWNQRATDPAALEAVMEQVRERGFALTDPEYCRTLYADTLWGISVPIIGRDGVHGALGLMILTQVTPVESGIREVFPALKSAAAELGAALDA